MQQTPFTTPNYDYGADIAQIERRRALAQALQQQGMAPMEMPQTPSGGFTPAVSPLQGIAKIAQTYAGTRQQKKADTQQRELAARTQKELADVLRRGQMAASGTPATPMQEDASGNVTAAQPAVAPNMGAAASAYMQHPQTAQLGQGMMQKEMENRQRQQMMASIMGGGSGAQGATPAPLNPTAPNASVMAGSGGQGYQPPSGGGGQPQNPLSGLPPQIVQLMTSGDPELVKLGTALVEANKPVVNRGFGLGRMVNGQYVPDQASLDQAMAMERGKAGISSQYAPPHQVPTSSGQNVTLFPSEQPAFMSGQLPARYGQPPMQGAAPTPVQTGQGGVPNLAQQAGRQAGGLGVPGLSQSQADVINQERQKAGGKALDEQFAKDYATFVQGGAQDTAKQLSQLSDVSRALKDPKANLTGPTLGNVPDTVKSYTNPQSVAMRERVEEVVQRSLRSILGAQFTEKEGERLIARAYNPRLSEKENAVRVDRLLTQLQQAYQQKTSAAKHFERHGTLEGWKGKMPSMGDFDPDSKTGAGASATIKFSDLP